jgi:hypothetical protein
MNLNTRDPNHVEQRKAKRKALEAATLGTIRSYLRDEVSAIAPPEWTPEMLCELVETKIEESKRIIEALSTAELETCMSRCFIPACAAA